MIQLITDNLYQIAIFITFVPLMIGASMGLLFTLDDICYKFKWYRMLIYDGKERDLLMTDGLFGKVFIGLGATSILIPLIVICGFLYITGGQLSDLWKIR